MGELVTMSLVAEQLGDFEQMLKLANLILKGKRHDVAFNTTLQRDSVYERSLTITSEERTIVNVAFSSYLREKREVLDYYKAVHDNGAFQKVTKDGAILGLLRPMVDDYRSIIEKQMRELEEVQQKDWSADCKIYLNKLILDCRRYLVESKIYYDGARGDEIEKECRDIDEAYAVSIKEANDEKIPYNSAIKLGLINNAVLYKAEVMGNLVEAYEIAKLASDVGKDQLV